VNSDRTLLAGRYQLGRVIGEGGFGIVYDAFDQGTRSRVAVKSLHHVDPERLFRFKREFRLLADCLHGNLIRYYELFEDHDRWFLAMERVDGVDLLSHVLGAQAPRQGGSTLTMALRGGDDPVTPPTRGREPSAITGSFERHDHGHDHDRQGGIVQAGEPELVRIRALLPQLAAGLDHLHGAGLIHRDLTPRNIMVDGAGRLVILDFGLALRGPDTATVHRDLRIGTPKYMAPEQAGGEPASPASDWYAVGAILYEMLTGVTPFMGSSFQVMKVKRTQAPMDPRLLCAGLPDDLCDLSMALLATAPGQRPEHASDLLRRCAASAGTASVRRTPPDVPFVGRVEQLAALDRVRQRAETAGGAEVVLLRGPSGMGKTALVNQFVRGLPPAKRLVLRSRCYQHESVPFKALDGLADALGEHLQDAFDEEVRRVLPHQVQYLARLFPSLRLVPSIDRIADLVMVHPHDPHEMRRRGFQALRELFIHLGQQQRLVVTIDDIQWGDEDSLNALVEVLAAPDAPAMLLVMCARSDDQADTILPAIRPTLGRAGIPVTELEVGPMSAEESGDLVRGLIASGSSATAQPNLALLDAVHRDSGGHPLFLRELIIAGRSAAGAAGEQVTLRDLLTRRLAQLAPAARRLLECAALAGRPRPLALLHRASGEGDNLAAVVHHLAAERLIRIRGAGGRDEVGVYHDKIAEVAVALIAPERLPGCHGALAEAIVASGAAEQEAEALSVHLSAAGDRDGAFRYGLIAADHAADTLAFDRAAMLYRRLLGQLPAGFDRHALQLKLADALANAGHGVASARAYAEAGGTADPAARLHALQRAAGQYLRSGYMDDGLATAKQVLRDLGLRWHGSSGSALLSLLVRRLRLKWRGIAFRERAAADIAEPSRLRMDVLWSLGHGLGGVDTVRGAEFHARHLLMALQAGDPYRVSRGLAWEAILTAAEGGAHGRLRARQLVEVGHGIARRLGNDHAAAWCWAAEAYGQWCEGRWNEAASGSAEAARLYREECLDITWELGSVYAWCWMPVLCYSGRLAELRQLVARVEREFGQLGDLYTLVTMRTVVTPWLSLADGDPERARRESAEAVAQWSKHHWHLQHLFDLMTRARAALYLGRGAAAVEALERDWPRYLASMQNRLQIKRMFMHGLRGQAVVMAVMQGEAPARRLRLAQSDARQLEREGTPWAAAYAITLRAALHAAGGRHVDAQRGYLVAAAAYDRLGMPLHGAASRRRAGEQGTGIEGRAQVDNADAELRRLGVAEPGRFAVTVVAGGPPRPA
jgi:serine/threonine protein kinase